MLILSQRESDILRAGIPWGRAVSPRGPANCHCGKRSSPLRTASIACMALDFWITAEKGFTVPALWFGTPRQPLTINCGHRHRQDHEFDPLITNSLLPFELNNPPAYGMHNSTPRPFLVPRNQADKKLLGMNFGVLDSLEYEYGDTRALLDC